MTPNTFEALTHALPEPAAHPARERLLALKERRRTLTRAAPVLTTDPEASEREEKKRRTRQRLLLKSYGIMTARTGTDNKMVSGTPFTEGGVAELMTRLRAVVDLPNAPGSSFSRLALTFLTAGADRDETVAGASVVRLKMLANAVDSLQRGAPPTVGPQEKG